MPSLMVVMVVLACGVAAATATEHSASALASFQWVTQVCSTCDRPGPGGGLRVVRANLANASAATSAEACAEACLAAPGGGCISFNLFGSACELNKYSEGYTVVTTPSSTPSQVWLRTTAPGSDDNAAQMPSSAKVPWQLVAPTGNVTVAQNGVLARSMEVSVDYLLRNYEVDDMLWWFRWRAQGMTGPSPPGRAQGWDRCTENLRKEAGKLCLKGSVASTFLMGAGGILRWPAPCCSRGGGDGSRSCCASRAELRRRFDAVLAGIEAAAEPSGFAAAFAENETMYRENPDYVLAWLTHGLLEADVALADGSGRALKIARGMIDWFSDVQKNWLLPEFMPPDRTITADVPPMYGANTGHQIYLISQGIIHHSRMATSAVGKQRDVDVIATLYQEDEWLAGLRAKDPAAIWQKKWFPHNYEVTAFEAYLDMYVLTGRCWHSLDLCRVCSPSFCMTRC